MYFNISPQNKKIIKIFLPVIIALILIFVISPAIASPQFHASTIEYLDGKGETVMEFAAVTASVSAGLSAIPSDAATPIADQLAQMSVYFLIVMCALYLEKYLIVITGCLSFKFLMPAACILLSVYFFTDKQKNKTAGRKTFRIFTGHIHCCTCKCKGFKNDRGNIPDYKRAISFGAR